jgi:hypothetical protein
MAADMEDEYKTEGWGWYKACMANNPDGERAKLNPACLKHQYARYLNNPLGYRGHPKNNPADDKHPLWFTWVMIGSRYS